MFRNKRTEGELKLYRFILKKFGYKPKSLTYFQKAVTHRSYIGDSGQEYSNERLEYLGDAILDSITAEYLFLKFPESDEGALTKLKSKIVNRKNLSKLGEDIGIRDVLLYNKSRSINISSLEGNAFEAIVGAIYLDGGYDKTKKILNDYVFRKYLDFNQLLHEEIDFKSKLYIWCQRKKLKLHFKLVSEEHASGQWEYTIIVQINNQDYGLGKGKSKKVAEQNASKETFELLGEL
ncbi:MAG: ribonuclease III [Crocinitomicaceae bacterium]|nr:ribonuclease III [Crocinitomicaceae bacterium]